ncbi:MAG: universal stress protein [Pseudomonadota bacterium]
MAVKIVIGLDGTETGERALAFAQNLASQVDACELICAYVVEWSPFTFQTAEENEQRHKRREDEVTIAQQRVVEPAVASLNAAGFAATGVVQHGDVAETLNRITMEQGASQIIVGRVSNDGFTRRIFGSSTQNLVMHADVPVTVVG